MQEPRILRDDRGREVVAFTTASGVTGIVATSISQPALEKFAVSLRRKMARQQRKQAKEATK
jgi:hypothetical protein